MTDDRAIIDELRKLHSAVPAGGISSVPLNSIGSPHQWVPKAWERLLVASINALPLLLQLADEAMDTHGIMEAAKEWRRCREEESGEAVAATKLYAALDNRRSNERT